MFFNSAHDRSDELLEGLTPSQRRAVVTTEGPLLVLAGPGSGKTRVITRRIAYLVNQGVKPWRILALTFTNKAAQEMRHRVSSLLGGAESASMRGLTVATFHSLCVRLLRRYCELGGLSERGILKPDFSVYDSDDQSKLIKRVVADLQLSTANFPPRSVLSAISAAKNELIDSAEYNQRAHDFFSRTVAKCYATYQAALRAANACDFDDLLVLTAKMLSESPHVRAELRARYSYLLIDEYQDTNRAQFVIASLLAGGVGTPTAGANGGNPIRAESDGGTRNVCVVGDPDQSIYGWRGADISNILRFEEQFPGAQVIALGENFRSREPILAVADRLIKKNSQRRAKPLTPTRSGGEKIEVALCRDEHHEARLVVDWISRVREGVSETGASGSTGVSGTTPHASFSYKDFAVFYRTNALSRVIEDELRRQAIPYTIVRGTAFFDREEVRNALAYLRLIANPADGVSLERIINTPARGIGDTTFEKFVMAAGERQEPVLRALRDPASVPGLQARATTAVAKFVAMLDGWTKGTAPQTTSFLGADVQTDALYGSLPDLVERVIRESGLEASYRSPGDEERLENLAELVSSAKDFEDTLIVDADIDPQTGEALVDSEGRTAPEQMLLLDKLRAYLERVALVADTDGLDPTQGAVTLMTLHAAKGLEFPCVAMIGLEEGCLPHSRAQTSDSELEEERRLCFVGVTRAMERLHMTCANFRTTRGLAERTIPSRFLDELNGPEVSVSDQSDPFGNASDDHVMHDFLSRGSGAGGFKAGGGPPARGPGFGGPSGGSFRTGGGGGENPGAGGPRRAPRETFEDDYSQVPQSSKRNGEWSTGTKVRHPQFGVGEVKAYIPGATPRVTVKFAGVGEKTLVLEYARLTRL
ncbi:MAG: UvrD-helicase domain-containing protein [Phycisphaerales bacterium]|nr:UvrD-helicase domain-containing protein [Phycisphaerales bacterium]